MLIYLIRHGQTSSNIKRVMDTLPPGAELTAEGREQAARLGPELAELIAGTPRVLSSVAIRTQQTAVAAIRGFEKARGLAPHSIRISPVPGVQEISAGDYEMSGTEDAYNSYMAALRGWLRGDPAAQIPGGETYQDLLARYRPVVERAVEEGRGPVLVFSHGAAIRVFSAHACGVDPDFAYEGYLPNGRFIVLETGGKPFGQWELMRWADTQI